MVGVLNWISYQIDGSDKVKCGSLHKMGAPLFVLLPFTAQLLLPLFLSGLLTSLTVNVVSLPKYNESAVGGFTGIIPGRSKTVSLGIIGADESETSGYNNCISLKLNTDFWFVN